MRAALLSFLLFWDCSAVDSSFLRSGTAARRQAGKRLQSEANKLAKALRWTFGDDPNLVSLARDRLTKEANELVDFDGAPLVSNYIQRAPPSLLIFGTGAWPGSDDIFGPAMEAQGLEDDSQDESFSSQTQESVIRRDGNGRTVRRTRRCKNGECIERTEVGVAPVGSLHGHRPQQLENPPVTSESLADEPSSPDSLSQAVRSMANSMHSIEQSIGRSGLEDLLDGLFRHKVTREDKTPWMDGQAVPDELAEGIFDHQAEGNGTESHVETVSSSTEVVVDNGKVKRRTQHYCKNGHCETKVEEGGDEQEEPEATNQTVKGPVGGRGGR